MKFIEIRAHDRTYFINPEQITHAEGNESGQQIYIALRLTEIKNGESVVLLFQGNDALPLFDQLRMVGVM